MWKISLSNSSPIIRKACALGAYEAIYRLPGVEQATACFDEGRVTALIEGYDAVLPGQRVEGGATLQAGFTGCVGRLRCLCARSFGPGNSRGRGFLSHAAH